MSVCLSVCLTLSVCVKTNESRIMMQFSPSSTPESSDSGFYLQVGVAGNVLKFVLTVTVSVSLSARYLPANFKLLQYFWNE